MDSQRFGSTHRKSRRLFIGTLLLAAAALGIATLSQAGNRGSATTLFLGANDVTGYMGAIRNSTNRTELADCSIYGSASGRSAYCSFRDAAGTSKACSSSNANIVAAAASMNGDSAFYIQFDASGACTFVQVVQASYAAPKQL